VGWDDGKMTGIHFEPSGLFTLKDVSCTRLFVVIQGTIGGLAGMIHGIYEVLRGNTPTEGYLLSSVGVFTLIPNYLITGITAIVVSLALILWTVGFIHKKNGPTVFLLLFVLLFLVGGGIAQVLFFLIAWGVSTQINQPAAKWEKVFSPDSAKRWASLWSTLFIVGYLLFFIGFAMWLFVVPPGSIFGEHIVEYLVCWSTLSAGLIFQVFTIVSGFARDFERLSAHNYSA
jgi:hypothetical protein